VGLLVISIVGMASLAVAGIPDLGRSSAVTAAGASIVSVETCPSGDCRPLNAARTSNGTPGNTALIDATITLTVLDGNGDPIYLYPSEDLWLQTTLGGLKLCPGGSVADFSTDIHGVTTFSRAVYGGGHTEGEQTVVVINGSPLVGYNMNILWNGPDNSGDLKVDLTDMSVFGNDVLHPLPYHYRSDMFYDNQINLSDMSLFAQGIGKICP
jgi:hypothetical protein